jgi:Na+/proline symporter
MTVAGTSLGMLLAIYLLGMLMPHTNLPGVLIGFVVGLVCLVLVWRLTEIPTWWYGAFTIIPTFVTGSIASLLFPKPPETALENTLLRNQKEQKI